MNAKLHLKIFFQNSNKCQSKPTILPLEWIEYTEAVAAIKMRTVANSLIIQYKKALRLTLPEANKTKKIETHLRSFNRLFEQVFSIEEAGINFSRRSVLLAYHVNLCGSGTTGNRLGDLHLFEKLLERKKQRVVILRPENLLKQFNSRQSKNSHT